MKDLMFKERSIKKLVDKYVSSYIIDEVVFINVVRLRLLTLVRIYIIVNVSWVVRYRELVEE